MFRLHLIVPLAAGLALAAVAAPQALAFAPPGQQGSEPSTVYTITQKVTKLSPITVYGKHIPFPLALQMYKKALTRPWSVHPADSHKLVCRWVTEGITHLQTLLCQTNAQHEKLASATQLAFAQSQSEYVGGDSGGSLHAFLMALESGQIPQVLANATTKTPIKRGPMEALLGKLPPANASYTLRVTGKNGKPILDYVLKDGNLVHIYHYVYKNGKATKTKH